MGSFVNILFFGISFIALAISSGFITDSARKVTSSTGYSGNAELQSAHKYLTIASVIAWLTVAGILVLGILYLIYGAEIEYTGAKFVVYGLLFISLATTITVGILGAISAQKIGNANVANDNGSRKQAIIGTILAIVTSVGIIALLIYSFIKSGKKITDTTGDKDEIAELLNSLKSGKTSTTATAV